MASGDLALRDLGSGCAGAEGLGFLACKGLANARVSALGFTVQGLGLTKLTQAPRIRACRVVA